MSTFCLSSYIINRRRLKNIVLQKYTTPYALTDSILQATRTAAKLQVFGDASRNVTYAHSLVNAVKEQGHFIEIELSNYATVMRGEVRVLTFEENRRLKA